MAESNGERVFCVYSALDLIDLMACFTSFCPSAPTPVAVEEAAVEVEAVVVAAVAISAVAMVR